MQGGCAISLTTTTSNKFKPVIVFVSSPYELNEMNTLLYLLFDYLRYSDQQMISEVDWALHKQENTDVVLKSLGGYPLCETNCFCSMHLTPAYKPLHSTQ